MTDFRPIIRHCDLCGKDMSIHSLAEQYPCSIYSDGLTLCGACFCVHTNTEPVDISGYEPHHLVWPDDVATDDEQVIEGVETRRTSRDCSVVFVVGSRKFSSVEDAAEAILLLAH